MDDVNANDQLAFVVEVVAFVSLGIWGWRRGRGRSLAWKLLGMLGALTVCVVLWALFVSPEAVFAVPVAEVLLRVAILTCGVLAFGSLTRPRWAVVFGVVTAVNTVLIYLGPFAR